MKKTLFTVITILSMLPLVSNAQWTTSGSNIYNTNSGYVGIGYSTPFTKLVVGGSENTGDGGNVAIALWNNASGGNTWYLRSGATGTNTPAGGFSIADNSAYRFVINSSGNIGIGTTSPDQLLTVNGTIHSTEVKVDLSVPAPDYVFKPDYKLASLAEVKAFVDKNHHLPEIPSAAEMAKNGLDLGDMNTRLLKKVEELTLYLIEKERQVAEQKLGMEALQDQLNQIKKQIGLTNHPAAVKQ